ncbi:hypothetical protein I204_05027 [Kwoniella mangroviensis CBS 8886]|nr:hypothetical protein I204_05027 [Kwoniella mangroviensis CBS 8886]
MTIPAPSSPPRVLRNQVIIFSPPKVVEIDSVISKRPSTPPDAPPASPTQKESTTKIPVSAKKQPPIKKKPSMTIVMGPHSYQQLDLFSSDESSNEHTHSSSRSFGRGVHIRSKTVSPTPTPRRPPPIASASDRAFTPSPEPIDWLDFSDPQIAYEEYGSVFEDFGSWSGESSSDGYDSPSPVIITPEVSQAAPRMVFNSHDLSVLFGQPALFLPPTPPSTPFIARKRIASKSPDLSIILSVSTPSTPFNTSSTLPNPHSPSSLSAPGRLFNLVSSLDIDLRLTEGVTTETSRDEQVIISESDGVKDKKLQCSACGKDVEYKKAKKMIPCGDMTPEIVEGFLPPNTLSEQVPQAIHIPLNRYDGKTKDYLYIEVASLDAAKHILQTRQNNHMPGGPLTGGKKRPVTITIVSHIELVTELRPHTPQELHSLLNLCHMALGLPTPASRFVKSRHGPFYALMSIMSKLSGKGSPAYWDLFHIASG